MGAQRVSPHLLGLGSRLLSHAQGCRPLPPAWAVWWSQPDRMENLSYPLPAALGECLASSDLFDGLLQILTADHAQHGEHIFLQCTQDPV